MSFILDALRKSDAQRRRGATPALVMPQAAPVAPARPRNWPTFLIAALLIAAGIAIGSMRPWQTERPVPASEVAAVKPREAVPTSSPPAPPPEQPVVPAQSAPASAAPAAPRAAPSAAPPAAAATKRQPPAPAKAARKASAPEQEAVPFSELPVAVQQEIPPLSITAHAYSSEARNRLIGIDDRVLREGEDITPNLRLEQITPEGMIMTYKGYRFRRGAR